MLRYILCHAGGDIPHIGGEQILSKLACSKCMLIGYMIYAISYTSYLKMRLTLCYLFLRQIRQIIMKLAQHLNIMLMI